MAEGRSANWEVAGDKAAEEGQNPGERAPFLSRVVIMRESGLKCVIYGVFISLSRRVFGVKKPRPLLT